MRSVRVSVPLLVQLAAGVLLPAFVVAEPEVPWLSPAGGQRGQTVVVTAGGKFPTWPIDAWTSSSDIAVTPRDESGILSIEVAADASPGVVWLRCYDKTGAASPRPWIVGSVPEVDEQEPNDEAAAAQTMPLDSAAHTIVVNGRLEKAGDVDVFALDVPAGQTLVADLDARIELASPFDGVIQILGPTGFVAGHNDDQQGLDPRLAVDVPTAGRWMVRVFGFPETPTGDVQLAGNEDYVYRLTISTGAFVNSALPLAARRGTLNRWQLTGWNLPSEDSEFELVPPDNADTLLLARDDIGKSIRLPIVDCPTLIEAEPNQDEVQDAAAIPIELPISITGRIDQPRDRDAFRFDATKGEQLEITVESRQLGYPLDPVLQLFDAADKLLIKDDDSLGDRDAKVSHTVAADGPLRLVVADLHAGGGPDYLYRLSVLRAKPSYVLRTESHQAIVKAGETTDVTVTVTRNHGHDGVISLVAEDLPAGVTATPATSNPGDDSAAKVTLKLTAAADAPAASVPFRIVGRVECADAVTTHFAVPAAASGLSAMWLTVTEP